MPTTSVRRITAWRITHRQYRNTAFSGEGAKEYGGRFNSIGIPIVYTSESQALATLELLTTVNERRRLTERICLPVTFSTKHVLAYDEEDLPAGWDARPYGSASRQVGDEWAQSTRSLVLRVPSVVLPREHNYLINPRHPDVDELEIGEPEPLNLDPRILDS